VADLTQALFRIDPTEGLLQYVQAVKPYHSKVLDVFVEYVYTEAMAVQMQERLQLAIDMEEAVYPLTYSCGYGLMWSPYSNAALSQLPQATIVSGQAPVSLVYNSNSFLVSMAPQPAFNIVVSNLTTNQLTLVRPYNITAVNAILKQFTVTGPLLGPVVVLGAITPGAAYTPLVGTATYYNVPLTGGTGTGATATIVVTAGSVTSVTMALRGTGYAVGDILSASAATIGGTGSGFFVPVTSTLGPIIYVRNNTDSSTNVKYTVASVVGNVITVVEPVSLVAANNGSVNVPIDPSETPLLPFFTAGVAIQLTTTGTLPVPVAPATTYYFRPTPVPGVFNLGKIRYPQQYNDIVNLTSLGTGQLTMTRVEPFVPGDMVTVAGTFTGADDGVYIISSLTAEGPDFRLHTLQSIPLTIGAGGTMVVTGDFGSPYCAVASSPDLFMSAYFSERIEFDFGPIPPQPYLLDTFSGYGTLNGHVTESGHTWSVLQDLTDTLDELIRDGSGNLVTSDVFIWAKSSWVLPSPTYYVEVELFVKEKPLASAPYFRFFVKETGVTFYGPYIDIKPDVSGKIFVDARDGDLANLGSGFINTGINVNTKVKVKLRVVGGNTLQAYVNNILVYTSGVIAWPALVFAGFNFTVPAGDPTQFVLDRVLGKA
jgi:hypothetical protein